MNARDYALHLIDQKALPNWAVRPRDPAAGPALPPVDPRDAGLAENIFVGVVKNTLHLQTLVGHYSGRPLADINPLIQKILAIGMYQLRFLDRVPEHAAVDEAVNQTKRQSMHRAAGFVNAVLRNALRDPMVKPPLPTAAVDPRRYAELVLSHPPTLYNRMVARLGADDALKLARLHNEEPPTIVRLFPGVTIEQLVAEDVTVTPHEDARLAVVEGGTRGTFAAWSAAGLAQVQDATAARVIDTLDVQPGQLVLDRCCGLGTKTMQLSAAVGPTGRVVAMDPSGERITALRKVLKDRGVANVTLLQKPLLGPVKDRFDRVLVDAPCSNSGVIARRPEARYTQDDAALKSLAALQDKILDDTTPHVAPGGLLVYSTCSIWDEENQHRVAAFLARNKLFTLDRDQATLPSLDPTPATHHDGGYVAVMRRTTE